MMELNSEFMWHSAVFLLICLSLFVNAKFIFRLFNPKVNTPQELVDKDNPAFYIAFVSYFIGVLTIIAGVMKSDGTGDFWNEVLLTIMYGNIGVILLNTLILLIDKTLHRSISLWEATTQGQLSIGILKGGNYISTAIIISGVMLTEVEKPIQTALYLIGAVIIASIGYLYYNLTTPFNSSKHIYKGNSAVAISSAGAQIAFAILIYAGFQLEHSSWIDSLKSIGIDIIAGMIILPTMRFILDKVFLPSHRKITEEMIEQNTPNWGLGLFEASAYIGGVLLFVWCWNL